MPSASRLAATTLRMSGSSSATSTRRGRLRRPIPVHRPSGLRPVGRTVVDVDLATAVATVVVDAAVAGLVVLVVRADLVVVVVAGWVVDVERTDVVVVGTAVVVSNGVVVGSDSPAAAALSDRRIAGSLLWWGTPAMATPTPTHMTSVSTVIRRCPGLTDGPSRVDRTWQTRSHRGCRR